VAHLPHGIKPVSNKVPDSEEPPDYWASAVTPDQIGLYPLPPYPAGGEEFKPQDMTSGCVGADQKLRPVLPGLHLGCKPVDPGRAGAGVSSRENGEMSVRPWRTLRMKGEVFR